jgi:hypothetical protein
VLEFSEVHRPTFTACAPSTPTTSRS